MKINLDFYEAANVALNSLVAEFEEELSKFKQICDAILEENRFGKSTETALATLSSKIYKYSSEELSSILANIVGITEGYCTSMDGQDEL